MRHGLHAYRRVLLRRGADRATAPILNSTLQPNGCHHVRSAVAAEPDSIADLLGRPSLTQMYGPAVRRKRVQRIGGGGLASMYPASD